MNEDFLYERLEERRRNNNLRSLRTEEKRIDFCSNDYLGIVTNRLIGPDAGYAGGSTGSRLLRGNYALIEETEEEIARFHQAPAGLILNSGYDANLALLSAVPQRGDTILYDYLSHASIRDGIRLSLAEGISFTHNEPDELEKKLRKAKGRIFVVTESVFSMDGDIAPLETIADLCDQYGAGLIVDEAHATGLRGPQGEGEVQSQGLQERCFARIHTFGKACGVHGAIILGSAGLRQILINFARPLVYSTALPPRSVADIRTSYRIFPNMTEERSHLEKLILQFLQEDLPFARSISNTSIQPLIVPGNDEARALAARLQQSDFDVRPILYPTVPKGSERLRIVFHAFNTPAQVNSLLKCLKNSD